MSNLGERFTTRLRKDAENYSDKNLVSIIVSNLRNSLYHRAKKKYFPIVEAVRFLTNTGLYPSAAPSYMLGRAVDDMSDGDLDPKIFGYKNFPDYIEIAKDQLRNNSVGVKKDFTLGFLLKYTLEKLEKDQKPTDNVRQDWDNFFDAMLFEYDRRIKGKVLTIEEIKIMYDNSFRYAHNIMLISLHSKTRYQDIEEIGQLQGRIFALNDLKPELFRHICNIPKKVLMKARLDPTALMEDPNLLDGNEEIINWIKVELKDGKKLFQDLQQKIPTLDRTAQGYLFFLMKGIEMGIKKAEKKYSSTQ